MWWLSPEWLNVEIVASNVKEFHIIRADVEFASDWEMVELTTLAEAILGTLGQGQCYSLRIPAGMGGTFEPSNLENCDLEVLIEIAGQIAGQIDGLPAGTKIDGFTISD